MTVADRPLTFGLIGCGAISTQHFEAISAIPGARLGAVASASSERARAAGERWGVPWTTNVDELLGRTDLDAITITTPSGLHAPQALAALASGRHVLVEKPLALTVADADAVIDAGRRQGRTVGTVSQRRFEPIVQAAREAVVGGALGRVTLIIAEGLYHRPQSYYDSAAWRGTVALDGGVLMNQAIHLIDLVRWFGGPVESVAAQVATLGHDMEAEDTAAVSLRFANGALAEIVATTTVSPESPTELRIHGDRGHIRIVGEAATEWDVPGVPAPSSAGDATIEGQGDGGGPAGAPTATWGTTASGYVRQYTDYLAAVREARPPFVSGEDGRNAVELVTAAYEASRTGRSVELAGVAR
jgi:UDP-N-acetyl-2-amino-2-deoxyglucuronate dehydrogenase